MNLVLNPTLRVLPGKNYAIAFKNRVGQEVIRPLDQEELDILFLLAEKKDLKVNSYHLANDQSAISEAWEILRDDGILIQEMEVSNYSTENTDIAFHIFIMGSALARIHNITIRRQAPVWIIDEFFEESICFSIDMWVRQLAYSRIDRDNDETKDLHWVKFLSPPLVATKNLPFLRAMDKFVRARFIMGKETLLRAHVYSGSAGDVYSTHSDSFYKHDVTAVYYPSFWIDSWGGELLFYKGSEPRWAVAPKRGRLIVFNGHIPHRIGVISNGATHPRYSIVLRYGQASSRE